MKQKTSLFIAVIVLQAVLNISPAHASLVLTYDTSEMTYAWTGSATSPQFTVALDGWTSLTVVDKIYTGGWGAIVMPNDPGAITVTQFNDYFTESDHFFETGYGSPSMIQNFPGISASVAYFNNYVDGGATGSESDYVEITGNGLAVSYASTNPILFDQISALDGHSLYFMRNWNIPDTGNQREVFPTQIGTIHVIPEPSTLAFIGVFGGGLWIVRRFFPSV